MRISMICKKFIEKIRITLHLNGLRKKLLIALLLFTIIPTVFLGILTYTNTNQMIENQAVETYVDITKHLSTNIERELSNARNLGAQIAYNQYIVDILENGPQDADFSLSEEIDEFHFFRDLLLSAEINPSIYRVRLFIKSDHLLVSEKFRIYNYSSLNDEIDKLKYNKNKSFWSPTRKKTYTFNEITSVFTFNQMIYPKKGIGDTLGVVMVDMAQSNLLNIIADSIIIESGYILVTINAEYILDIHDDNKYDIWDYNNVLKLVENNENGIIEIDNTEYLYINMPINNVGWNLRAFIPNDVITKPSSPIKTFNAILVMILALLAVVMAFIFSKYLSGDYIELASNLQAISEGNYTNRIKVNPNGDIAHIQDNYNEMAEKIENLIKVVYVMKISKQEAEMKALENQIKPHFLYNTLDSLRWMALQAKQEDIAESLSALSKYFFHTLNNGKHITTVDNEIKHVKAYIYIHQMRTKDKIEYIIDIDDSILEMKMLKLLMQPLVENAIFHGIQHNIDSHGIIEITGKKLQDTGIYLSVKDNGVGISDEKINNILSGSYRGVGIHNVMDRIELYYSKSSYLNIESVEGEYTKFELFLTKEPLVD